MSNIGGRNGKSIISKNQLISSYMFTCMSYGGFIAEHIGSVPTEALFLARMSRYASSIRVVCIILLVYFIYREKNS